MHQLLNLFMSDFNSMKQLFIKLLLLTLIVGLILFGIDHIYRQTSETKLNFDFKLFPNKKIDDGYEIVKLGNSHAVDGITFKKYQLKGLDLAGVAQRFSFDLALLKQHHKQIKPNATILITITPISFSHRKADRNDGLQGMYYSRLSPFLIPDLKIGDYIQVQVLPFLRSGYLLRKFHQDQVEARIAQEEKWEEPLAKEVLSATESVDQPKPKVKLSVDPQEIYFNVEAINQELSSPTYLPPEKLIDSMNTLFDKWYHTDEFNQQYFAQNRKDLEKLIDYCLKNHWRPVLVSIPVSKVLVDGLMDDYMQVYLYDNLDQVDTKGLEYLDYNQDKRLVDNDFLFGNADHLNSNGQGIFSYVLLQDLIKREYLPSSADGYDYGPLYIPINQAEE